MRTAVPGDFGLPTQWEDDYCEACGHHNRYHFDNGVGQVFCRWNNVCACAECPPAVSTEPSR